MRLSAKSALPVRLPAAWGLLVPLLLLFLPDLVPAKNLNSPTAESLISLALPHAYRHEYEDAHVALDRLISEEPDNPAGYFFKGALWQLYMYDMGTDSLEYDFLWSMRYAQEKAVAVLKDGENARAHLYLGATYAYRAIYYGWMGRYWDTYRWGVRVESEMARAYALDSSLTDACLALGVSEYFRHIAGRYLTGLGVFGSYRRGVRLVNRAAEGGGYFAVTASYALAWIMWNEKHGKEARALLGDLLAEYPGNRLFRRMLRDACFAERAYADALEIGIELDAELTVAQPDNTQVLTENCLVLAKSYLGIGDRVSAAVCCDRIIACEGRQDRVVNLKNYVREARAMRRSL